MRKLLKNYVNKTYKNKSSLARIMCLNPHNLYDYISGKSDPSPAECIALAQLLDIPRKDFINIFINDTAINDTEIETE